MGEAARKLNEEHREDPRSAPRASVYVNIDLVSEHNFWSGLTMNMSEGGVFVATHHVVPIGSTLVLNMLLPFSHEPVVALAEVCWTRAFTGQDDVPPGLGLRFVSLDDETLSNIRKFVATVREPLFFEK